MKWRRLGPNAIIDDTRTYRIFKTERTDGWIIYHCHYAPNERYRETLTVWSTDEAEGAGAIKAKAEAHRRSRNKDGA